MTQYYDEDFDDEDDELTEEDLAKLGYELVEDQPQAPAYSADPNTVAVPLEEAAAWADAYEEELEEAELEEELFDALEAVEYELGRDLTSVEADYLAEHAIATGQDPADFWDELLPGDLSDDDFRTEVMAQYMSDEQDALDEAEAEGAPLAEDAGE